MGKLIDLTGQRFGRLTVLEYAGPYNAADGLCSAVWHCRCDCGEEVDVVGRNLRQGLTRSCGCLRSEKARANIAKARMARIQKLKEAKA